MRKLFTLIFMLISMISMADTSTWVHEWNVSKANGGEGFYHISDNEETTQVAMLKGVEWTYSGNVSVTAYTASAGQYFGSAKSPVIHATLSTDKLQGKIQKVIIEAKKKDAAQEVNIGVKVNNVDFGTQSVTTERAAYTYVPTGDAPEGEIVITMDQPSETKGIIYFFKITIEYDGAGPVKPEPKDPELSYSIETVEVEKGDNAPANPLNNPYKVSPITYSCSDIDLAVVTSNGNIYTTGNKIGSATVTATFAGNDDYKAATASYTLVVKEKPVIPAPTMSPAGGTFTEPVTVTITSDDPLCKAIWYSTTIKDVEDLGYDDNTIIVPGQSATVTLDDDCTLLAVAVGDNNVGLPATGDFKFNIPLKADFSAAESAQVYYEMGWDDVEEASTWHYYGINDQTWTLATSPQLENVKPFSTIDPKSNYSLTIFYANSGQQRERAVSPELEVKPNSNVEFYLAFGGVWLVYANLTFVVNDLTEGTQDVLFDAFKWAQANNFTGPSWEKFTFDLSKYAGHKCTFEYKYEGTYGDNMAIDGFKLKQESSGEDAKISVLEGGTVHFLDKSQGHPTAWNWTITGEETFTSTVQNPAITFQKAGKYTVKLVASKGADKSEMTKTEYVIVTAAAPKAHIGLPEGAYRSPYAYAFVPTKVPVTFQDQSTGNPTSWKWTFEGTDVKTSNEQHPTVTYSEEGKYGLELVVENAAGTDRDFLVGAIQAGGKQEVWNIAPEEIDGIGGVSLSWYGCYAGTNYLGMKSFAEKFGKPMTTASIEGVTLYFDDVTSETSSVMVTVTLHAVGENGMPGAVLATAQLPASDLQVSKTDVLPTKFMFDAPVEVDGEFFVVVDGMNDVTGYYDNINLLCVRREGVQGTTYHLLEDEDEHYQPLGTYTWVKESDEGISMCVAPIMEFTSKTPTGIGSLDDDTTTKQIRIYDLSGRQHEKLQRGINIVNGKKVLVK